MPKPKRQAVASPSREAVPALAVFARAPSPKKAKTRLIPILGPRGAADFHAALISDTLRKVNALVGRVSPYFFLAGRDFPFSSSLRDFTLQRQRGKNLGERLGRAFRRLLRRHASAVVIGTDSPLLSPRVLRESLDELRRCDAVLGPCPDGGFYLIGLRRHGAGMFRGVRWGSPFALRDTLRNLRRWGFACSIIERIADVDRPEDVHRLKEDLTRSPAARRLAPSVWRFLKEFFVLRKRSESLARRGAGRAAHN